MPFNQITPRPFNAAAISLYAPPLEGVYGITNQREWIFIGVADNIQFSLLDHLSDLGTSLLQHQPAGFVFERCSGVQRVERQRRLIEEYAPVLSTKENHVKSYR
jgi:hypothetical protein